MSQICEILLRIGAEQYKKDGARFLQRYLERRGLKNKLSQPQSDSTTGVSLGLGNSPKLGVEV